MILTNIELKNFRCHKEFNVPLNKGVTVISGGNGSGKSSIFMALIFALWGTRNLKPLVTTGATDMSVRVQLEHNGDNIVVFREAVKSGSKFISRLSFEINGISQTQGVIKETQEHINETLGTEDTAYATYLIRQGHLKEFIAAPPSRRREVLGKLLNLSGYWKVAHEKSIPPLRQRQSEYDRTKQLLETRQGDLEGLPSITQYQDDIKRDSNLLSNAKQAEERYTTQLTELSKQEARIQDRRKAINDKRAEVDRTTRQINDNTQRLNELDRTLKQAPPRAKDDVEFEIKGVQQQIEQSEGDAKALYDKRQKLSEQIGNDESEITKRKAEAQELKNSPLYTEWERLINEYAQTTTSEVCRTCGGAVNNEQKERMVQALTERANALKAQYQLQRVQIDNDTGLGNAKRARDRLVEEKLAEARALEQEMVKRRETDSKLSRAQSSISRTISDSKGQLEPLQRELRKVDVYASECANAKGEVGRLKQLNGELETTRKKLNEEIVAFVDDGDAALADQIQRTLSAKKEQTDKISTLNNSLLLLKNSLENRKGLERVVVELETKLRHQEISLRESTIVTETLAPQGARQSILDYKLVEICTLANKYLEMLADPMSIQFATQRESGHETIEINVSSESLRPIETYSGGEQTRLAFVLRLAFLAALAKRDTRSLLLLDEPFGDQDKQKAEMMNQLILSVASVYEQMVIISHSSALIEGTDQRVEL